MQLKPPDYAVPPTPSLFATSTASTPAPVDDSRSPSPQLDRHRNLSSLELADSTLELVSACPDCHKPLLRAALESHQLTCPESNNSLKRKLSQDSNNPQQTKKSKITLHLTEPSASPSPAAPVGVPPVPAPLPVVPTGGPSAAGLDKKNKRVVDPDRQCGVINERGLPCQRSLTCKTHNMTAKRAVPHRSQPFDSLLMEWQKASRLGKEREALSKSIQMRSANEPAAALLGTDDPTGAKKEKRNKKLSNLPPTNGFDPTLAPLPLDLQPSSLLSIPSAPTGAGIPGAATSTKKSKKSNPAASASQLANGGSSIYYVGELQSGLLGGDDLDEESDYLSSSDEVESVLVSIKKVTQAGGGTGTSLTASAGGGVSSASWWTGRNRKLMRLRTLGLDTVFGAGSSPQTNGTTTVKR
ncbi:deubiquitination module subunit SGF73 [Sporobolomyces koalae]|uniref:deubiquitination module subunit SGF73 n=1 Tax=Sporobolomyces koalae TaxID=500713 RepID=UPI00318166A2